MTADINEAEDSIKADKARAEEIRQRCSDGDQERSDNLMKKLREREAVLQQLEAKLEELELKETEQALALLGV
jgi:chromosome segregation ATPase